MCLTILLVLCGLLGVLAHVTTVHRTYHDQHRNHDVTAKISYASSTSPDSSASSASVGLVVFSHGLMSAPWFQFLADAVVEAGMVFASLDDYDELHVGTPQQYANDLAFLKQEIPADTTLPVRINVTRIAVGGHSEGGAGTFVAANATHLLPHLYKNDFAAAFTFSGCLTGDMTYIEKCTRSDTIPWMVFAATLDCLCRLRLEEQLYGMLPAPVKYFVSIQGGTHCDYMDAPKAAMAFCDAAEEAGGAFCHVGHHVIAAEEQRRIVTTLTIPWLQFALFENSDVLHHALQREKESGAIQWKASTINI